MSSKPNIVLRERIEMGVPSPPIDWLLETGDSWVQYRTRLDLMKQKETDPDVQTARAAMIADPRIKALIAELQEWPGPPLTSHKQAQHPLHKLAFLAEIGLQADDPGMEAVVQRVLERQSAEGAFQISVKLRKSYGGTGESMLTWMLCDAPTVLYALCKFGLREDHRVAEAVEHIRGLIRENGWPCVTSPELGLRGPGRKDDPCPYATLVSLKALAAYGGIDPADETIKAGIGSLLWHWEIQQDRKLYLFGIGTDFRKPKLPLVWYDILHVVDVLSRFPSARSDYRFMEMLADLMSQADDNGRFTPASMYRDWKEWEFASKKQPSPGITLIAWRAAARAASAE
jgi:hypothetical protein